MTKNDVHKTSHEYLNEIASNIEEKASFIINAVKNGKPPKINSKIKLLEVGIGGGYVIDRIKDEFGSKLHITAIDVYPELINLAKKKGLQGYVANICELPFKNNSFSCVNASSVLHEVSSYGFSKNGLTVYGVRAVEIALEEIKRVLCPQGLFFYRDVLAPDKNEIKKVFYKTKLLKLFLDHFLLDFIDSGPALYRDKFTFKKMGSGYLIKGESKLHREIQKHYLLWILHAKNSFKSRFSLKKSESDLTHIENYISKILNKKHEFTIEIEKNLRHWLAREGKEYYVYLSIPEIIKYCSKRVDKDYMILSPKSRFDIKKIIRKGENKYLKQIIINPEVEGKQIVSFSKTPVSKMNENSMKKL